ncbi:MAG: cyclic nucleotide-binding domain-containing protein [Sulfuritalea sp.]|nr:cyclic nucleotide-binding domain-containing protein [Sulfuritalea sp.]
MDDLDFSGKPAASAPKPVAKPSPPAEPASLYEPRLALEFFKIAGTLEQFPAGKQIFAENEKTGGLFSKGARIYLLLDGDVTLTIKGKPLELVLPGEIFGEMAAIADAPRSATATARKACRVLSIDEKAFLLSLQRMPEFALMLMSVMAQRLRRSIARLAEANKPAAALVQKNSLDRTMLSELRHELGDPQPTVAQAGQNVVTQGALGACMFVVTKGRIAISVDGKVIEYVEAGGVFGEMALVERAGRAATATAATESAWLLIARNDFLAMVKAKPAFGIALLRAMAGRVLHIGKLLREATA